jgi:hypothetical protein
MPDSTKEAARGRRSQARERRRARLEEPSEKVEQTARSATSEASSPPTNGNLGGAAAKVVGTAVAAGLLGALGGAVKAVLERRDDSTPSGREPEKSGRDVDADTRGERARADEQPDEPVDVSADAEWEPEAEASAEPEARGESRSEDDSGNGEVPGLSDADATDIASGARRHLETLLGTEVERVSGLERADGRWSVRLEVVEMARIPESTDVLATYEVVLDDDGGLVSVNRVRRYRRSQVEEEA